MQPYHILVCEQNPDHAELLVYNLKKAGYHPTIFPSGKILDHALDTKPKMIILGSTTEDHEKAVLSRTLKENPALAQTLLVCLTTDDCCSLVSSPKNFSIDACLVLPQKPKKIIKSVNKLFTKLSI